MLSTHLVRNPLPPYVPEPFLSAPWAGVHRGAYPLYTFPHPRVVKHLVRGMPLRTSTLRTLGSYTNVMAIETMMDALAREAGIDALEFRLRHLVDERARAVLQAVCARVRWGERGRSPGNGRGLAFARYNNLKAYAAVVADVVVDESAHVRVTRVTLAADVGQIVDRDGVRSQLEGGAIQAVSWTLCEQVTYDADGITSRDWDSYPILRFDEVPDVETILIDRPGHPYLGPAECALSPTGAAIANAIHDAVGLRPTRLPFDADALRAAALR
jgi:CO/xanthine dehydrogenase Mo-binding subunit